jgi:hypothetical protein
LMLCCILIRWVMVAVNGCFAGVFLDGDFHGLFTLFYPSKTLKGKKGAEMRKQIRGCIATTPYFNDFVCMLFSVVLPLHFPMQKLENIFPSKSSEVTIPVISARLI